MKAVARSAVGVPEWALDGAHTPTMLMLPPSRLPRRTLSTIAATLAITTGAVAAAGPVAAQVDDKRAQAAELQDQIEASDVQIGALSEQLHVAEAKRDAAQAEVADAQSKIQAAKQEVRRIKDLVEQNLASLYRRQIRGDSGAEIDLDDSNDLLKRGQYAEAQASRDDRLLERLARAQDDLAFQRDESERARAAAAAESEQITAAQAAFEAARGEQQALLDKVTGELAAAVEAERSRRAEAARVKFSAPVSDRGAPASYPDVGPPNGSASQAIAFARSVIGAGYSLNPRMGPTYDCSGLTTMAWRAAGVNIPTVSGTQYAGLPHVPMDAIQPGDLIFWGPGGSAHVALYIGGGQIIDASSSQNQVMQRAIFWQDQIVGAARVT